jgi:hypothetical protein
MCADAREPPFETAVAVEKLAQNRCPKPIRREFTFGKKPMHWPLFVSLIPSAPLIIWLSRKTSHARPAKQPLWWLLLAGISITGWHFCGAGLTSLAELFGDPFFEHSFEDALCLTGLSISAGNLAIASLTMFLCSISRPDANAKN